MARKKIPRYVVDDVVNMQDRVRQALRLLQLDAVNVALSTLIREAEARKLSYLEFIDLFCDQELGEREDKRIERWRKKAGFPWLKTMDQFDFTFPESIEKEKIVTLAQCDWIGNGGNVIFFGPSGGGKTNLSIALGLEAVHKGYETRFVSVDKLTEAISIAVGRDKLMGSGYNKKKLLLFFSTVPLLILDELAYSKVDQEVADFLFQLMWRRHENHVSTIITSNEGFATWDRFFANNQSRAVAVIDRLLQNCVPINIRGRSFRTASINLSPIPA